MPDIPGIHATRSRQQPDGYRAVIATTLAGFYRATAAGQLLEANEALWRMFGYADEASLLAVPAEQLYARPEERRQTVRASEKDPVLRTVELEVRRRDGSTFWISTDIRRVEGATDGSEIYGIVLDISERRNADDRLRRRMEGQGAVLEFSRVAVGNAGVTELLQTAVHSSAVIANAPLSWLLWDDPDVDSLSLAAVHGFFWDGSEKVVVPSADHAGALVTRPSVVDNPADAEPAAANHPFLARHNVQSSITVRVELDGRKFGVIGAHDRQPRRWTEDDVESMQLVADMLAVALQRREAEDDRRRLLAQLARAQEEERRVIAGDIHDDAVQVMAATNMRLELLRRKLVDPEQVAVATTLQNTIEAATGRLRSLLFNLTPPDMESYGLAAAIRAQLEQLALDDGVQWTLDDGDLTGEPVEAVRVALFRICQEALVNVRKHAKAQRVTVRLRTEASGFGMSIHDDGIGFNHVQVERRPGHLGLVSMRERAGALRGRCQITTGPGDGTDIEVWVPGDGER